MSSLICNGARFRLVYATLQVEVGVSIHFVHMVRMVRMEVLTRSFGNMSDTL